MLAQILPSRVERESPCDRLAFVTGCNQTLPVVPRPAFLTLMYRSASADAIGRWLSHGSPDGSGAGGVVKRRGNHRQGRARIWRLVRKGFGSFGRASARRPLKFAADVGWRAHPVAEDRLGFRGPGRPWNVSARCLHSRPSAPRASPSPPRRLLVASSSPGRPGLRPARPAPGGVGSAAGSASGEWPPRQAAGFRRGGAIRRRAPRRGPIRVAVAVGESWPAGGLGRWAAREDAGWATGGGVNQSERAAGRGRGPAGDFPALTSVSSSENPWLG